jgi:hypothetical protein
VPQFTPTIIVNTTPAVTIAGTNISYAEIKRSLGDYAYYVASFYIESDNLPQITEIIIFNYLDKTGNQRFSAVTPTIDPYQGQSALYFNTKEDVIIIDGNSQLSFNFLPNTKILIKLYTDRVSKSDELNKFSLSNFQKLKEIMQLPFMYNDWEDKI